MPYDLCCLALNINQYSHINVFVIIWIDFDLVNFQISLGCSPRLANPNSTVILSVACCLILHKGDTEKLFIQSYIFQQFLQLYCIYSTWIHPHHHNIPAQSYAGIFSLLDSLSLWNSLHHSMYVLPFLNIPVQVLLQKLFYLCVVWCFDLKSVSECQLVMALTQLNRISKWFVFFLHLICLFSNGRSLPK